MEAVPIGEALQGAVGALAPQHAARAKHLAAAEAKKIAQMLVSAEGRKSAVANRLASAAEASVAEATIDACEAYVRSSTTGTYFCSSNCCTCCRLVKTKSHLARATVH